MLLERETIVRVLEGNLSCDLASSTEYPAGADLPLTLYFYAPDAGGFYLLGALYSTEGVYIPGTTFGVVEDEEGCGVASGTKARLWSLTGGEDLLLPCRFAFDRSDVVLGLFLLRLAGDEINLATDTVEGQLAVALVMPASPVEVIAGMSPALLLLTGMMTIMMEGVFHE